MSKTSRLVISPVEKIDPSSRTSNRGKFVDIWLGRRTFHATVFWDVDLIHAFSALENRRSLRIFSGPSPSPAGN